MNKHDNRKYIDEDKLVNDNENHNCTYIIDVDENVKKHLDEINNDYDYVEKVTFIQYNPDKQVIQKKEIDDGNVFVSNEFYRTNEESIKKLIKIYVETKKQYNVNYGTTLEKQNIDRLFEMNKDKATHILKKRSEALKNLLEYFKELQKTININEKEKYISHYKISEDSFEKDLNNRIKNYEILLEDSKKENILEWTDWDIKKNEECDEFKFLNELIEDKKKEDDKKKNRTMILGDRQDVNNFRRCTIKYMANLFQGAPNRNNIIESEKYLNWHVDLNKAQLYNQISNLNEIKIPIVFLDYGINKRFDTNTNTDSKWKYIGVLYFPVKVYKFPSFDYKFRDIDKSHLPLIKKIFKIFIYKNDYDEFDVVSFRNNFIYYGFLNERYKVNYLELHNIYYYINTLQLKLDNVNNLKLGNIFNINNLKYKIYNLNKNIIKLELINKEDFNIQDIPKTINLSNSETEAEYKVIEIIQDFRLYCYKLKLDLKPKFLKNIKNIYIFSKFLLENENLEKVILIKEDFNKLIKFKSILEKKKDMKGGNLKTNTYEINNDEIIKPKFKVSITNNTNKIISSIYNDHLLNIINDKIDKIKLLEIKLNLNEIYNYDFYYYLKKDNILDYKFINKIIPVYSLIDLNEAIDLNEIKNLNNKWLILSNNYSFSEALNYIILSNSKYNNANIYQIITDNYNINNYNILKNRINGYSNKINYNKNVDKLHSNYIKNIELKVNFMYIDIYQKKNQEYYLHTQKNNLLFLSYITLAFKCLKKNGNIILILPGLDSKLSIDIFYLLCYNFETIKIINSKIAKPGLFGLHIYLINYLEKENFYKKLLEILELVEKKKIEDNTNLDKNIVNKIYKSILFNNTELKESSNIKYLESILHYKEMPKIITKIKTYNNKKLNNYIKFLDNIIYYEKNIKGNKEKEKLYNQYKLRFSINLAKELNLKLSKTFDYQNLKKTFSNNILLNTISEDTPIKVGIIKKSLPIIKIDNKKKYKNIEIITKLLLNHAYIGRLFETRSKEKYDRIKKRIRYYETTIRKYILKNFNIRYHGRAPSRGWLKFYEIITNIDIIDKNKIEYKTMHYCEAPGNFILALGHYLKTKTNTEKFNWHAQSLNPKNKIAIGDDYKLIRNYKDRWDFGVNSSGDITDRKNLFYYKEKYNDVDLITFDCGLNWYENRKLAPKLLVAQLILLLYNTPLNKNGIIKHRITMTDQPAFIGLIYLLIIYFEKIYFYKPMLNPWSGEFYIIGKKKEKEVSKEDIDKLLDFLDDFEEDESLINIDEIPKDYIYQIYNAVNKILDKNNFFLNRSIYYIDISDKLSEKDWELLEKEIKLKDKEWVKMVKLENQKKTFFK